METNNNKEFIFKKCQAYKKDFPEIQKDLNIFLNFKGILKYPIESPFDQKIDNLIGVLNWDIQSRETTNSFNKLFQF